MAKYARIRLKAEFSTIYKNAKKWHCEHASVYFLANENELKFAPVASKKIGNAVKRNKAKRRLRAVFASLYPKLKNGSYIITAKQSLISAPFSDLSKNLIWSISKIGAFK